jgi:hypothetical protein
MHHTRLPTHRSGLRVGALAAAVVMAVAIATTSAADASSDRQSNAPFPGWYQGFTHDADEWAGSAVDGPDGWCGSIDQHDRGDGPVAPSTGGGYAVATGGACNAFWTEIFGPDFRSGPFAAFTPLSTAWPVGGYVMEMDVHLDPVATSSFAYYAAISLLDVRAEHGLPASVRYFEVPVQVDAGQLTVHGEAVTTSGWHTFRHRFGEDADGQLTVEFELAPRSGPALFTVPVEHTTLFGMEGEPTSSFEAANVGNAYVWLQLAEGQAVPIDEYRVRRGR